MQGRIAMSHALGDSVAPLNLRVVSANIFTDPEISTVGCSQRDIDEGRVDAREVMLPLSTNPRAKMQNELDGFVKLFAATGSDSIVGGVVVGPQASELIFPVALAVQHRLTVDQIASTITIYPSLSGSIAEAARRLHTSE
jgi:dihydrolipoamide dehydrogenase